MNETLVELSVLNAVFPEDVVDHVISILEIYPEGVILGEHRNIVPCKNGIREELNAIKYVSDNQKWFEVQVAPAKLRDEVKNQRNQIQKALSILHSLKVANNDACSVSQKVNIQNCIRQNLYRTSDKINKSLSPGLLGYDVVTLDSDYALALKHLEKVEKDYGDILCDIEKNIKGRGGSKPKNDHSDYLLFLLCKFFRNNTGDCPKITVNETLGSAEGKFIQFLDFILPYTTYKLEKTHYALEKRLRFLKKHDFYSHLWADCK